MHPYLSNGILVMLWMYFKHHAAVATKRLLSSGKACNLGMNGGSCGDFNLFSFVGLLVHLHFLLLWRVKRELKI